MSELPLTITKAIRRNKPVEFDGLTLYPILMDEYDEFCDARYAVEFMQQSLPVRFAVMPLLNAYYALEVETLRETGEGAGFLYRVALFLCLSLRLGQGMEPKERVASFIHLDTEPEAPDKLKALQFTVSGKEFQITPAQFSRLRPILAAQNGLTIPDEAANKELIGGMSVPTGGAEALDLILDFDALLASVAIETGCDEEEIMSWPVRKFQYRRQAIDRRLKYQIYGMGEMSGVKWKGGNPVPTWCFDRRRDSTGLISMSDFSKNTGGAGVENRTQ